MSAAAYVGRVGGAGNRTRCGGDRRGVRVRVAWADGTGSSAASDTTSSTADGQQAQASSDTGVGGAKAPQPSSATGVTVPRPPSLVNPSRAHRNSPNAKPPTPPAASKRRTTVPPPASATPPASTKSSDSDNRRPPATVDQKPQCRLSRPSPHRQPKQSRRRWSRCNRWRPRWIRPSRRPPRQFRTSSASRSPPSGLIRSLPTRRWRLPGSPTLWGSAGLDQT